MLNQMNQAQQDAVLHGEGPLLVLAGPGSGKTFTITQRILYLIKEQKVPPEEILVITFTKEAALSMQRRFADCCHQNYPVNFGTFHSCFYHILKVSGCFGSGQILGESQKKKIIFPIMRKIHNEVCVDIKNGQNKMDLKLSSHDSVDTSSNLSISSNRKAAYLPNILAEDITNMMSAISYYKNTGSREGAFHKLSAEWQNVFSAIYEAYESERIQRHALDFDDMVYECEKLLRNNREQREYWQKRFRHILMDEFQDINPMQYRVIKLLADKPYNLFAVGDDDQAIYGFRGSEPACLRQFVEDYRAKQILLNVNYRSNKKIVGASLLVIGDNKERFPKKLEAFSKDGGNVVLRGFIEREEQYQYLLQRFSESIQKDEETHAVLFRTNSFMQGFAIRLKREGIAFEMKESQASIYEHFLIKDIMAYLRIAAGEQDKNLWMQILNKPSRYISREALAGAGSNVDIRAIREYYRKAPITAVDFAYMEKIHSATQLLEKHLDYLKKASPYLAVQYVWKVVGYERYLKTEWLRNVGGSMVNVQNGMSEKVHSDIQERSRYRLEEMEDLFQWLKEDAKHYETVAEWLWAQSALVENIKANGNSNEKMTFKENVKPMKKEQKIPKIHLMTIHASKGLEFDHVWIPDCNEKVFPHGFMPDKELVEEERRIFYVAMTRAKKSLELLYLIGTKERPRQPSRFLNPLWKREDFK